MSLDDLGLDLWNAVFIPFFLLAARAVSRGFRAPELVYSAMRDVKVRALESIEGVKAPWLLISIVERVLPGVAPAYAKAVKTGTVRESQETREQELLDRMVSQSNVHDVNEILAWGGKWEYLQNSLSAHVAMMRYAAVCGGASGLLLVPLTLEAMTPRFHLMPSWFLVLTAGLMTVAFTLWIEATLREVRMRNRFYAVAEQCE